MLLPTPVATFLCLCLHQRLEPSLGVVVWDIQVLYHLASFEDFMDQLFILEESAYLASHMRAVVVVDLLVIFLMSRRRSQSLISFFYLGYLGPDWDASIFVVAQQYYLVSCFSFQCWLSTLAFFGNFLRTDSREKICSLFLEMLGRANSLSLNWTILHK